MKSKHILLLAPYTICKQKSIRYRLNAGFYA